METERKRNSIKLMYIALCLIAVVLAALAFGSVTLTPGEIAEVFFGKTDAASARIMLYVRIPRVLAAIFAGAGLAAAGAIIQSVLHNPLAGPNIIGVNAGAGFAVVLFGAFVPRFLPILPLVAFIGALAAVLLVYTIASRTGMSKLTLVLTGVALNSFLSAASDAVIIIAPDALSNSYAFKLGGLSVVNLDILYPACICIGAALLFACALHKEMDVLALGEETARSLGLKTSLYRFLLLMTAAVLAGAAVSFAGLLGFIGLIVPHIARMIVGNEGKYMIPASAMLGALTLTLCDLLARKLFAPYEIPVGIILSFLGAPFFLYLLFQRQGRKNV